MGLFVAAGVATTAVLGAQGNPSPANTPPGDAAAPPGIQKPAPAPSAQAKANTVTFTGCIQDAPMTTAAAAAPASPGRAESSAASTKTYYLNNATMAADAGKDRPAVGTSGLAATGYRLEGDNALITPHLNHQVRIVGMVQSSNASEAGAANAAAGSTASGPSLKVESVTMVAAKCEATK
jgi:hypothetical protein